MSYKLLLSKQINNLESKKTCHTLTTLPSNNITLSSTVTNKENANNMQINEKGIIEDNSNKKDLIFISKIMNKMIARWQNDRDMVNSQYGDRSPYWGDPPIGEEEYN